MCFLLTFYLQTGVEYSRYIKRITSVVEAISGEKNKLTCKVSQLVKLIKDNKPFKMSKRKGDYITVEDLIEEVGNCLLYTSPSPRDVEEWGVGGGGC